MMYGVPNMKTDKIDVVQRRVDLMAAEVGRGGGAGPGGAAWRPEGSVGCVFTTLNRSGFAGQFVFQVPYKCHGQAAQWCGHPPATCSQLNHS